jgi:hypothetical protein
MNNDKMGRMAERRNTGEEFCKRRTQGNIILEP